MARILVVLENELTDQQKHGIRVLMEECFSHVDPAEARECFYAESFGRILAFSNDELVGHLRLFKRTVEFDGREIKLGGMGGVCVSTGMRGKGIAARMVRKGVQVLRREKVDVACLNADLSRGGNKFYEKLGFVLMNRKISFEDVHGNVRYDDGTMFIPVCSKAIHKHIMESCKIFHYGRGYW